MDNEQNIKNSGESSTPIDQEGGASRKKKDPKKVAAGKALARKNAEVRKIAEGKKELPESLSFNDVNYNIKKAAGFVGVGFVLYHGWKFFTKTSPESEVQDVSQPQPVDAARPSGSDDNQDQPQPVDASRPSESNMIDMN